MNKTNTATVLNALPLPQLVETYERTDYSLYGLWRITLPAEVTVDADGDADDCLAAAAKEYADAHGCAGWDLAPRWASEEREAVILTVPAHQRVIDVGCVVGVPESDRGTAQAAATNRGLISAWYADSSDWSDEAERDAAIEVMEQHAVKLCRQHEVA